jgi:uncharacterized membrane protein
VPTSTLPSTAPAWWALFQDAAATGGVVTAAAGTAYALHRGLRAGVRAVVLWACASDVARRDAQHEATLAATAALAHKVDAGNVAHAHAIEQLAEQVGRFAGRVEHLTTVLVERAVQAPPQHPPA